MQAMTRGRLKRDLMVNHKKLLANHVSQLPPDKPNEQPSNKTPKQLRVRMGEAGVEVLNKEKEAAKIWLGRKLHPDGGLIPQPLK